MNPDGFTLAGQRKRCSILRCKMVCRFAVPSAFVFAVRAAHLSAVFYARKPDAV
jgi:hypothetical protein